MDSIKENHDVVIVGGGICGLATALALHKKGFQSLVLERSESLRATGAAFTIFANGWRVLDQLGVGDKLRQTSVPFGRACDIWIEKSKKQETLLHEAHCLKRSALVEALADALPPGSLRFGCEVVLVETDPKTNYTTLQLDNDNSFTTKVLIGGDGSRSIVARFLKLSPPKKLDIGSFRGLVNYPYGHKLPHEVIQTRKDKAMMGRIPITDTLVYWFVGHQLARSNKDISISRDPKLMKQSVIESLEGFPSNLKELIKDSNLETFSFYHIKYRAPWDLLFRQFKKGTIIVVGDNKVVGNAFDQYLNERRWRLLRLSIQSYLSGVLFETTSLVKRFIAFIAMISLFGWDPMGHTKFDCGRL